MNDPDRDNSLRPFAAKLLKIPMNNQQMQGYIHPQMNNEPLKFNNKKGKPPMPIENDMTLKRANSESDEMPMPPLPPPMENNMGNMGNSNMGLMGGGFYSGPVGPMMGPMMGPGPSPEMMNMNQMMMFGGMGGPGMQMGTWSGGPMPTENTMMIPQKEIITLKSCVLYPPPPNAPPPTTRERPLGCRTIFVGGLPEIVTEECLEEVFSNYGAITSVRKSKKKNFAHVRFEEEAAVERSLFLSGYRMKVDDKDDKPSTGRLHVDYAMARDDQYEYECKMRAQMRDMRHRQRLEEERLRPPSPPPVTHYSDYESAALLERLRSDDDFMKASQILLTWFERGEVNRKNINQFYSMIQCTNAHIRRLLGEKQTHEEELMKMKEKFKNIFGGILRQFDQIEKIFTAAQKQRNWDHFTKAQRKNIELWLKQAKEIKASQQEEFFSERQEDEMEMSDDEEGPTVKKKNKTEFSQELTNQYAEMAGKLSQINTLKDENDSLKCQVEAYKNEVAMMKTDDRNKDVGTKQEVKSLQLALQGMQQQLITSRSEVEEYKKKLEQEKIDRKIDKQLDREKWDREQTEKRDKDNSESQERKRSVDTDEATISSTGLHITDKDAKLVGLVCCFLHVHPTGASLDYIWSYLHRLGFVCRASELENLLERMNMIFRQEVSGVGATIERRWHYTGYRDLPPAGIL